MNNDDYKISFEMPNNDGLRAAGLAGEHVWGVLRDGALILYGNAGGAVNEKGTFVLNHDKGGTLRIAAADVMRLRVGYGERKGLQYRTVIWRVRHLKPLRLCPLRRDWNFYTQAIRGFAAAVAAHGGTDRVETGASKRETFLVPQLLLILPLGFVWLRLADLIDDLGQSLIALIIMLALFFGWIGWRSPYWPRRLRDLSSLDDFLPGTNNALIAPFAMAINDDLRKLGLAGENVWVTLRDGALELEGDKGSVEQDRVIRLRREEGGWLRIDASEVTRLGVDYSESRYGKQYLAVIRHSSLPEPIQLAPYPQWREGYTQTMQAFAARIAEQGGMQRIETGLSKSDALVAPVLFGLLALGAICVSLFALTNEPWWARLIVPAIPVALFLLFLKISGRHWPRPIRDLADLEGLLPPVFNGKATGRDAWFFLFGGRRR